MKRILFVLLLVSGSIGAQAQEYGRNIGSVSVTYNGQPSKTFKFEDDQVELLVPKESISEIVVSAKNKTSTSIYFNWTESYFLINGETIPVVDNSKGVAIALGIETKEANSTTPNSKIAPNSKIELKLGSKKGMLFDYSAVNKYFKEHGKVMDDKIVLVFEKSGELIEKVIPIQVYTGRVIKQLKR
ncbi:hypothetical protein [Sphingobacterium multivorum]|uniref:hypothetical protein n=1 Tax=Sphingobacterium multivorum TaxID=28454 RepID=UPI0036892CEA